MNTKNFAFFDYFIFTAVLLLVTIGIFFIYSSGINSEKVLVSNEYIKQIFFAVSGLFLMLGVSLFDYRKLRRFAPWLFVFLIVILLYTKLFGRYVNGARSWIGIGELGIQPSEFCKILFIIFLAWYLEKTRELTSQKKRFLTATLIFLVPVGLILLQPDLGTASVYIPIFLIMCYVAGVPIRYIMIIFIGGMLTIFFTVLPIWEADIYRKSVPIISLLTNMKLRLILILIFAIVSLLSLSGYIFFKAKYYYWICYVSCIITAALILSILAGKVLKPYQINRLIIFLNPETDPLGAGWNIRQSKTAIGAGGFWGQGFLKGTQSHYRYLPQQSNDFIFSILSEEWGFMGCILVFILYLVILIRGIIIIKNTNNNFGYYISAGITFMFFFHFIVNVGMVMGIMPITGIPLLFLSYGGSSLWTAMIAVGLLMSINFRRLEF
ncbi:MAG: rod shape-determining protein RodA [Treponema sp.]|nr:rod shape-determining protein RodA [Treponema sp.]